MRFISRYLLRRHLRSNHLFFLHSNQPLSLRCGGFLANPARPSGPQSNWRSAVPSTAVEKREPRQSSADRTPAYFENTVEVVFIPRAPPPIFLSTILGAPGDRQGVSCESPLR